MTDGAHRRFGIAWVMFTLALALHVADEATHDFLSTYNPSVRWIKVRLPFLPLPEFTFETWLTLLMAGILLLLCAAPLAFRGAAGLRMAAWPLGMVVGVMNALGHMSSSIYIRRWLPGVYSSPVLLVAACYLLWQARLEAAAGRTGG